MAANFVAIAYSVSDEAQFEEYQKLAVPTVEQYGGKFIAGGFKVEVADGNWSPIGLICIEFENLDRAKEWYRSPEYSAVKPMRLNSTDSASILVDGG